MHSAGNRLQRYVDSLVRETYEAFLGTICFSELQNQTIISQIN
jgi:hypothetical protein